MKKIEPKKYQPLKAKDEKVHVKGKRAVITLVIMIILIIILAQVLYYYVIPRVTIDARTVYHEATGGGGTGGLINVNSKIENSGTVEARDFQVSVSVYNSTRKLLTNSTYTKSILSPGQSHEVKLSAQGNCYEDFYIIVEIQIQTSGDDYYEKYNYKTYEDAMNIGFEDSIFSWGA